MGQTKLNLVSNDPSKETFHLLNKDTHKKMKITQSLVLVESRKANFINLTRALKLLGEYIDCLEMFEFSLFGINVRTLKKNPRLNLKNRVLTCCLSIVGNFGLQ